MGERMSARAAMLSAALGLAFFLVTATTFASLGVVLPAMIAEFGWSWATGGLGFTMLALFTGVFSPIAARSLERLGARLHYGLGGALAVSGYFLLSATANVPSYLFATSLLGAAFALLANVPGTYIVGRATPERRRNFAIGLYLAAGGAGGVFGPLIANALVGGGADWRSYWLYAAVAVAIVSIAVMLLCGNSTAHGLGPSRTPGVDVASVEAADDGWTARAAIGTPAFAIIAVALAVAYFCGVTVSTWSVAHLQNAGLAPTFAVAMFSLYSAVNAGARALGGAIVRKISARKLLVAALLANTVGMSALAMATSPALAIVFALFDGFAFGMALFATTALMIDYFGLRNSPALLGALNLAATAAMLGPTIAGEAADRWGGFAPVFLVYAVAALLAASAVVAMPAPNKD